MALQDRDMAQWAQSVAALVAGEGEQTPIVSELVASFCAADPAAARQLVRATFLGDWRGLLPRIRKPTLLLQCGDDAIVPLQVGEYMHRMLPDSTLQRIEARGHCPHLTNPLECLSAMVMFLASISLRGERNANPQQGRGV